MERRDGFGEVVSVPFAFVPDGTQAQAGGSMAGPNAVGLPAQLVTRHGVQRVQFPVPMPRMGPPPAGMPGRQRQDRAGELWAWLKERWRGLLQSERFDEQRSKPPPGSRPISQTPWSGNHEEIKRAIGAGPADGVRIAPDGTVWGENPDGSWTNHGPAENFIEGSEPEGRRGKDRGDRSERR